MTSTVAASPTASPPDLVGRGARDSARLTRQWFQELTEATLRGRGAAYVFVMGSMSEVLRCFDFPIVFPEVTALQAAVRGTSEALLTDAEDYGYSPDICGYLKSDIAMHVGERGHPMGAIPKPAIGVATNSCNTYFKWAEAWERIYHIPVVTIDVPNARAAHSDSVPGSKDYHFELDYVTGQIEELIATCERVAGRRFDIDRFRECLGYSSRMARHWKQLLELNQRRPAVFNALTDGLAYLGMVNCFRGTEEGATYFEDLVEEMSWRSEHGIGALIRKDGQDVQMEQKFRLAFHGVPCYSFFRGFNELFSDWGGFFVTSSYMHAASGGAAIGYEFDLADPIRSFAEGTMLALRDGQNETLFEAPGIESKASRFQLDGVVYHGAKSCRTGSAPMADRRLHLARNTGTPSLLIESDIVDPRSVSRAQLKNRADAFFEGLISRQQKQ